jgi:hypothetical protein
MAYQSRSSEVRGQKEEFKQTLNSESVRAPARYEGDGQTEKKVRR